ncbi:MAG: hypothetical protein FJX77_06285 [Armatimonadetes bacterium]|nr:hypothetical protein [Armatimonadota bacterium]
MDSKKQRLLFYGLTAFIGGAVIAGAAFQEQIGYYVRLKGWDREGPARSLSTFLAAGKRGDASTAGRFLGAKDLKPLERDGKWLGYRLQSMAGNQEFLMADMAPGDGTRPTSVNYIYVGAGAAEVTMPDAKGTPIKYRMEMQDGEWKVMEILGGKTVP